MSEKRTWSERRPADQEDWYLPVDATTMCPKVIARDQIFCISESRAMRNFSVEWCRDNCVGVLATEDHGGVILEGEVLADARQAELAGLSQQRAAVLAALGSVVSVLEIHITLEVGQKSKMTQCPRGGRLDLPVSLA